ncbi:PTS system mannose/fructose/sorbose family transporter subunit IID [Marinilactibacillus psychrotolerans]|uniref:PTS system mannose/fructose/sorbose family transporter subunit IID n=1 Tax=Marinilactibacillus psychrotolerans TaxID=191770 RepID=UPI0038839016
MENRKTYQLLDKKTLNKSYVRWMMYNLVATSFEFLEALGFAYAMQPIADKLYKENPGKRKNMLKRHSIFYNTEPQIGALINGVVCGLEEQKALGKSEIDDSFINSLKVGLMGPVAGIGDSMIPGMLIPILLSIGMGLSSNGSVLGPLFYIIFYNSIIVFGTRFLFFKGYELGAESVDLFVGKKAQKITQAFSLLGVIVVGGVAASYVNLNLPIVLDFGSSTIDIQQILDGIFPKLLPAILVIGSWYFMAKKGVSPIKMIAAYFILAFGGVGIAYLVQIFF